MDLVGLSGRNRKMHLVDVNYSSEHGFHKGSLFIKVFDEKDKVIQEAQGAKTLENWLENTPVKTPRLLGKFENILVYEGLKAFDFDHYQNLLSFEKYFLAGWALPYIHGWNLKAIDQRRYDYLINTGLKALESTTVSDIDINWIKQSLSSETDKIFPHSYGGGRTFGDFHPGNIMFSQSPQRVRTHGLVRGDFTDVFLIDPEFLDSTTDEVDRFEDLGNFLAKIALEEFVRSKNLKETREKLLHILNGYNQVFFEKLNINLRDLYPNGLSVELQIVMALIMDMLFVARLEAEKGSQWVERAERARIDLIKFLLNDRRPLTRELY